MCGLIKRGLSQMNDWSFLGELKRVLAESGSAIVWTLAGIGGRLAYLWKESQRKAGRFLSWGLIPEIIIGSGMGWIGGATAEAMGYPGIGMAVAGGVGVLGVEGVKHAFDKYIGTKK